MELPTGYTDPFTILFDGLWEVFAANPLIDALVRDRNRIKFDTVLGLKDTIQHGDLPEIVIVPVGHSQEDLGTSGTGRITESYRIFISTDDKRPDFIHALQWELYRCLETFNSVKAGTLLYNGIRFIELLRISSGNQSITNPELNRGIKGWCAAWDFTVDMCFPRTSLHYSIEE